jgi:hypothetical protein
MELGENAPRRLGDCAGALARMSTSSARDERSLLSAELTRKAQATHTSTLNKR